MICQPLAEVAMDLVNLRTPFLQEEIWGFCVLGELNVARSSSGILEGKDLDPS